MSTARPPVAADVERREATSGRAPQGNAVALPADLKAEVRRLLTEILVADYRADHIKRAIDTPERTETR